MGTGLQGRNKARIDRSLKNLERSPLRLRLPLPLIETDLPMMFQSRRRTTSNHSTWEERFKARLAPLPYLFIDLLVNNLLVVSLLVDSLAVDNLYLSRLFNAILL